MYKILTIVNNYYMTFTLIVRSILIYAIVLFLFRIMGKRQLGEMQPYELVITLIIADLATIPMSDTALPLTHGIIPIISIALIHYFLAFLTRKSLRIRRIINGTPVILITPDGVDYDALKKLNMNFNDLMEGLRTSGYFNLEEILYAILQTNGSLSVLPRSAYAPLTSHDVGLKKDEATLPIIILAEGKCISENLAVTRIDENFIKKSIATKGDYKLEELILVTINNQGRMYVKPKKGSYFTIDTNYSGGNV